MAQISFSLCIGIFIVSSSCASENQNKPLNYRLNTDILPIDYTVELTPYFDGSGVGKVPFTFDGIVTITIKARRANVDTITVHKLDLDIHGVSLTKNSSLLRPWKRAPFIRKIQNIAIKSNEYDDDTHKYSVKLASPLIRGEAYDMHFWYTGKVQSDMTGLYRSSYVEGSVTK